MTKTNIPQKVNCGVHIRGSGKYIDVVVKRLERIYDFPVTELKVTGVDFMNNLFLTSTNPNIDLVDGINVGVETHNDGRGTTMYCAYNGRKYQCRNKVYPADF